jgi:hypothetical protein
VNGVPLYDVTIVNKDLQQTIKRVKEMIWS